MKSLNWPKNGNRESEREREREIKTGDFWLRANTDRKLSTKGS